MSTIFEELDYQDTPLGEISLRRRSEPRLEGRVLYEVKLGEEFLMSSLFVEAEEQLSLLGLEALKANGHVDDLDVIVGGLGLGYTGLQALKDTSVASVKVIDVMPAVISWHQRGLLPIGDVLETDPRSTLVLDDFFAVATSGQSGFHADKPQQKVHAVLLDIDHSPSHWLNQGNSSFYCEEALSKMASKIQTGGVFGLWSNELPDPQFEELLSKVFTQVASHVISFDNPYSNEQSTNSVYVATVK